MIVSNDRDNLNQMDMDDDEGFEIRPEDIENRYRLFIDDKEEPNSTVKYLPATIDEIFGKSRYDGSVIKLMKSGTIEDFDAVMEEFRIKLVMNSPGEGYIQTQNPDGSDDWPNPWYATTLCHKISILQKEGCWEIKEVTTDEVVSHMTDNDILANEFFNDEGYLRGNKSYDNKVKELKAKGLLTGLNLDEPDEAPEDDGDFLDETDN